MANEQHDRLGSGRLQTKSTTFTLKSILNGSTILCCQCGWKGRMLASCELHYNNYKGDRMRTDYLCPRCLLAVSAHVYTPAISFKAQRDANDSKKKEDNGETVIFE